MDIKQLEVFVAVADRASFTAAAKALHLTQPTVSAHIAALERELDLKLFDRTTKSVILSAAGSILYPYAQKFLSLRQETEDALRSYAALGQGTVRIAASSVPANYHLPDLLQRFRTARPQINFQVETGDSADVLSTLQTGRAELGFTGMTVENDRFIFRPFTTDVLAVIAPNTPHFQAIARMENPMEALKSEPLITREEGSGTRSTAEAMLLKEGFDPRQFANALVAPSTESVRQMVSRGLGFSVISQAAAQDYAEFGRILIIPCGTPATRPLYLVRRKNSLLSPAARTFYDFVREVSAL